jgi:hypothetical protein
MRKLVDALRTSIEAEAGGAKEREVGEVACSAAQRQQSGRHRQQPQKQHSQQHGCRAC